ncbi:hypothetical protein CR513_53914, partial [Mucuna pruriens]
MCGSCPKGRDLLLSTFAGTSCSYCGKLMIKEMKLVEESKEKAAGGNGVFVKGDVMFLIFDDLTVLQNSPGNTIQQLLQLGYKDFSKMKEMSLNVGMNEIFSILKQALTSKTPLSDVFLANGESKPMYCFSPYTGPNFRRCSVKIKVTVSKSQNKILFAEAEGDFVDFLFSFLTTPLGSIMKLRNGELSLGCIDNLYTSVKNLNSSWFIGSSNEFLLNPRVAQQFGCITKPIYVPEEDTSYWYGIQCIGCEMISKKKDGVRNPEAMKIFDPRCFDGPRERAVGFVKRPCLFIVWDDLHVTTMTTSSSISLLQKLNVPFDDLEEHLVDVGTDREALNLLVASLTSKAALTESLFSLLEKRKEAITI